MTAERVNPFGDLGDFSAAPAKTKTGHLDVAEEVAAANGFTSRQPAKTVTAGTPPVATAPAEPVAPPAPATPPQPSKPAKETLPSRRRTTGRSEQVNIKTTFAAKKRLMEISVERDMPLGEVLELALEALERSWAKTS
jgi:hypothetical protein